MGACGHAIGMQNLLLHLQRRLCASWVQEEQQHHLRQHMVGIMEQQVEVGEEEQEQEQEQEEEEAGTGINSSNNSMQQVQHGTLVPGHPLPPPLATLILPTLAAMPLQQHRLVITLVSRAVNRE